METLNVIGGCYLESCVDPSYSELYGSGLRAAIALSGKSIAINFHTCVGEDFHELLAYKSKLFGFKLSVLSIDATIGFEYYHPLSSPEINNLPETNHSLKPLKLQNVLHYGMIEADVKIECDYLVYDPQNHVSFKKTGSTANHLALILNRNEALILTENKLDALDSIGRTLLLQEKAEIVIIKNGSNGALVFHDDEITVVPVFETSKVWPIGSGDMFSATFAYEWMFNGKKAKDAAMIASSSVAQYCDTKELPLTQSLHEYKPINRPGTAKHIYLAGPFFTLAERFLINETRYLLQQFSNEVFSPFHDAGILHDVSSKKEVNKIVATDLSKIDKSDVVFAVLSGMDPGTIFEIGYAVAKGKKVVVFCENAKEGDLVMLLGSGCEITDDFSTAIYKASW
jgi:hypothetical protein